MAHQLRPIRPIFLDAGVAGTCGVSGGMISIVAEMPVEVSFWPLQSAQSPG